MLIRDGAFTGGAAGEGAVDALGKLMVEKEKTRRLLIGASCFLFTVSALVVVFAPPEKQALAYSLGAALVVVALGAIGAAQFQLKLPGVEVETSVVKAETQPMDADEVATEPNWPQIQAQASRSKMTRPTPAK